MDILSIELQIKNIESIIKRRNEMLTGEPTNAHFTLQPLLLQITDVDLKVSCLLCVLKFLIYHSVMF